MVIPACTQNNANDIFSGMKKTEQVITEVVYPAIILCDHRFQYVITDLKSVHPNLTVSQPADEKGGLLEGLRADEFPSQKGCRVCCGQPVAVWRVVVNPISMNVWGVFDIISLSCEKSRFRICCQDIIEFIGRRKDMGMFSGTMGSRAQKVHRSLLYQQPDYAFSG